MTAYMVYSEGNSETAFAIGPVCLFRSVAEDWIEKERVNSTNRSWQIHEVEIIEASALARHGK